MPDLTAYYHTRLTVPATRHAYGYTKITSLDTPRGLGDGSLGAIPQGATIAAIIAQSAAVRWTDATTIPSATVGMPLGTEIYFEYSGNLESIKFSEQSSGAVLHVCFYGPRRT